MSDHSRNNPQLPSSDGNSPSSQSDRSDQPDQSGRPVAEPQASGPAEAGALLFSDVSGHMEIAFREIRENTLLEGFRDCEELVIGFLQREADKGRTCTAEFALRSAALAIRLGQYKDVEDVKP